MGRRVGRVLPERRVERRRAQKIIRHLGRHVPHIALAVAEREVRVIEDPAEVLVRLAPLQIAFVPELIDPPFVEPRAPLRAAIPAAPHGPAVILEGAADEIHEPALLVLGEFQRRFKRWIRLGRGRVIRHGV
jgi:hypothetical protein